MPADLQKTEQLLRNKLTEYFGEQLVSIEIAHGELVLQIAREALIPILTRLHDDGDFAYDFLSYCTAIDRSALKQTPRFEMIYQLLSTKHAQRLRVKALVPENDPTIESAVAVYGAADWMERETFDMFGIIFKNHPDLRRILMPEDWEGYPLRKDFPLGGVKSFYFKRSTEPRAGEPKNLVPRLREQLSDI